MLILVSIEGLGEVQASLIQRYTDGDVRVRYAGREYVCRPVFKEAVL